MQKLIKIFSIIGMLAGVTGALLVALGYNMVLGYSLFLVSSMFWTSVGQLTKNHSLTFMNIVFSVINIIGLYHWFSVTGLQ